MKKPGVLSILFVAVLLAVAVIAKAQQPKVNRVGVITSGGAWSETIDGLRVGLRQLGLEEGKQLVLWGRLGEIGVRHNNHYILVGGDWGQT
jgi:hypothetical protein